MSSEKVTDTKPETKPETTPETKPKSRGISVWTFVAGLLVVLALIVALGVFLGVMIHKNRSLERDLKSQAAQQAQANLDREKAEQNARLVLARNQQEQLLAQTRNATNLVGRLLQEVDRVGTEAAALKSNEAGRSVALHPDLVAQARRLYESELRDLPATQETITKLEAVRRVEQQLVSALGTVYQPAPELSGTAQTTIFWAEQGLRKVEQVKTVLAGLVQESKIKLAASPLTPGSPTLEAAILRLNQAETALGQKVILDATSVAKTNAAAEIANAESQRILDDARLKTSQMFIEASNAMNQVKAAQEELKRQEEALKNKATIADAETQAAKAKAEAEARRIREAAANDVHNAELKKKAQDPEIQGLLTPFTTPGYQQIKTRSYEKQAFSYSQLQSSGALSPTDYGLGVLAQLAMSDVYKERPRWKLRGGPLGWKRFPESVEQVSKAQKALLELGPVMVELKMLTP
jgi:hypothetical protein